MLRMPARGRPEDGRVGEEEVLKRKMGFDDHLWSLRDHQRMRYHYECL
jgi:hypothetical protein